MQRITANRILTTLPRVAISFIAINIILSSPAFALPIVVGNTVTLSESGWIEVQDPQTYTSECQGQDSCVASPGRYTIINHTTGTRYQDIDVGGASKDPTKIIVDGNRINLPDDGWYQVQNALTYASLCEGVAFCDVPNGNYIVVNHTTGVRTDIKVNGTSMESPIVVVGNTISWPDDGWYQVLRADDYQSVCEGTRQCNVEQGSYIVINHTTGERFEPIEVSTNKDNPDTKELHNLPAPLKLAERCIGNVNQAGVLFCVNPDTREFSATTAESSLWWSFTLPGDNATNNIESVLTVGDLVLLVANRFPSMSQLTPDQRANQFEVSVFENSGAFLRTIPLSVDHGVESPDEAQPIIFRGDQFSGIPARVVAIEQPGSNPQILFGWHRFRYNTISRLHKWDMAGISRFDLVTGERLADRYYPEQEIDELAVDPVQPEVVRVTTTKTVEWLDTQTLTPVRNDYFRGLNANAVIEAPENELTQINAANYLDIIARVMPWVNGEPAAQFFAEERAVLAIDDADVIERGTDEEQYNRTVSTCSQSGVKTKFNVRNVSIQNTVLDNCRLNALTYDGSYQTDFVGRDGSSRRVDMTTFDDTGVVSVGALRSPISYTRVGSGLSRTHVGTTVVYKPDDETEAVAEYVAGISFFYGRDFGYGDTCDSADNGTGGRFILTCTVYTARGDIYTGFTMNSSWSSYTNIDVNFSVSFGDFYYTNLGWYNTSTSERVPDKPIPAYYLERQSAPKEFLVNEGDLTIEAADGSKIVATAIGNEGQTVNMQISIFDKFGNSMGNFGDITIDVPCAERLNIECVVPQ